MNARRQRGLVLLPVVLALAVTSALTWAMVRDAAMTLDAVDRKYQAQAARYLAEAGLALARWQNQQIKCASAKAFGSFSMPGGTIVTNDVHAVSGGLSIDVSATTAGGATARIARASVPVYDAGARKIVTLKGKTNTDDTNLVLGETTALGTKNYMELTDGEERGVVRFNLPTAQQDVMVVAASFNLRQTSTKATTTPFIVYVQRATTSWSEASALWSSPWKTDGGDFVAQPIASMEITKENKYFKTRVDALADGWARATLPNYGVLLTSLNLNETRFGASEDDAKSPQLVLEYYPRCK